MLLLASSSATRAKILQDNGIEFTQKTTDFDEDALEINSPREFVYAAAMGKLESAVKSFGLETPILAADTVVTANNEILRKAKDKNDARRILLLQSGAVVDILTCTAYTSRKLRFIDLSVTSYEFLPFDEQKLAHYLDSDEWQGKAGACMVEGFCKAYIKNVHGYESCAMGLTIENLKGFLD